MKGLKTIKSLYFGRADYFVGDKDGNEIRLIIDYRNVSYKCLVVKGKDRKTKRLIKEAEMLAADLIKRKSNINRAVEN